MAGIARATQVIFGPNGLTGTGGFGAAAGGTVTTENANANTLSNIMSTAAWNNGGWLSAVLGSSKFPAVEDMNAMGYVFSNQIAYILERGIPEYDVGTSYNIGDICKGVGTTVYYKSLTNANLGNALTSTANWEYLGDLAVRSAPPQSAKNLSASTTSTTVFNIAADEFVVGNSQGNTVRLSTVNVNINSASSGANGIDTGAVGASAWYYGYVIYNPGTNTIAGLMSLSATAPTLPAGYTYFALASVQRTDGSSHFVTFNQLGTQVEFAPINALTNGTATSLTSISLSSIVPPIAKSCGGSCGALGTQGCNLSSSSTSIGLITFQANNTVNGISASFMDLLILTSQTIYYDVSASGTTSIPTLAISSFKF